MKSDKRAQAAITPMPAVALAICTAMVFAVFPTLLDQIPQNAPSQFCGGTCGTISNLLPAAMVLLIVLFVLFLMGTGVMGRLSR